MYKYSFSTKLMDCKYQLKHIKSVEECFGILFVNKLKMYGFILKI